jgi:hypothetical protein
MSNVTACPCDPKCVSDVYVTVLALSCRASACKKARGRGICGGVQWVAGAAWGCCHAVHLVPGGLAGGTGGLPFPHGLTSSAAPNRFLRAHAHMRAGSLTPTVLIGGIVRLGFLMLIRHSSEHFLLPQLYFFPKYTSCSSRVWVSAAWNGSWGAGEALLRATPLPPSWAKLPCQSRWMSARPCAGCPPCDFESQCTILSASHSMLQ